MYQFKTDKKLSECSHDEVVYIPEDAEAEAYTKDDLINLSGDILSAQLLLDRLTWQHPSTLLLEDELFD